MLINLPGTCRFLPQPSAKGFLPQPSVTWKDSHSALTLISAQEFSRNAGFGNPHLGYFKFNRFHPEYSSIISTSMRQHIHKENPGKLWFPKISFLQKRKHCIFTCTNRMLSKFSNSKTQTPSKCHSRRKAEAHSCGSCYSAFTNSNHPPARLSMALLFEEC